MAARARSHLQCASHPLGCRSEPGGSPALIGSRRKIMYVHVITSPGTNIADSMMSMSRQIARPTVGPTRERLSPCVCNTLRMVSRVVTQLYDDCLRPSGLRVTQFSILAAAARLGEASLKQLEDELANDQTTLTRSLTLLECDGVLERASHPDQLPVGPV